MSDQLEAALSRTLSDAAETAPVWPPNLMHKVEERHRARRRRRYATVAGVTAFTVITGSALVSGVLTESDTPAGPEVVKLPAAAPGNEPPVAKVWPGAYQKLPGTLADGREYRVEGMIDDHRVLISTEKSFEVADGLWALDVTTRTAHRLVQLPEPHESQKTYSSHFTIGSGHIVWWDSHETDGKAYTRIWKAPVTGGEPTLVSTVSGRYGSVGMIDGTGDRLAVHDDTVYFSNGEGRGVRAVPLAGGEATKVPDTKGYHILQGPWIASPGLPSCRQGCEFRPRTLMLFTELRNAETGEERSAMLPDGVTGVLCSVTYCVGHIGKKAMASTRDGSKQIRLPESPSVFTGPPAWDRFTILRSDKGEPWYLYDLKTGRSGDLGIRPNEDGQSLGPQAGWTDRRSLVWSTDDGETYHLLDLAAIK